MEQDIRLHKVFVNTTPENVHIDSGYAGAYGKMNDGVYEEHILDDNETLRGIVTTLTNKELVVTPTFSHATYGRVAMLNDVSDVVESNESIRGIKKVYMDIVGASSTISGDVVLIPILNNVEQDPIVINVGTAVSTIAFTLEGDGILFFKRDHENVLDTLKDEDVISLIILDINIGKLRLV